MNATRASSSERKEVTSTVGPAFGTALKGAILSTEALASHSKDEIATVGSYLEPFMKKLGGLSEEYELEKSSLERSMFESMSEGSKGTTNEIIDQRASARHYVSLVNDFFKRTESIVMSSMQARRDAERRFTERLLEATQQEYEHVILSMRAEDRKKANFERDENHKKLDNCRTAVRLDLAAMLLQQRASLNRKRDQDLREVEEKFNKGQKKAEEQVRYLEGEVAAAKNQRRHAEKELKYREDKLKMEMSETREDMKLVQAENDALEKELRTKEETVLRLTEEADVARDELHSAQKNFEDEIKDLQRRLNRKDDEMHRKEARLLKRCEEMTMEIREKSSEIEDLRARMQQLILDHDELQQNMHNAHQKFTAEAELLEQEKIRHQVEAEKMREVAEELREEIRNKEAAIHKVQHQLTEESDKVDRVEAQLKLVDDERATVRRMLNEMRAEVHVWLLDQIYIRKLFSIDPGFDGSDLSVTTYSDDFQDLEHRDVQALLHILQGQFSGTYAESHERQIVEKLMKPYFMERIKAQQQEVVVPGPGSNAAGSPNSGKEGGGAIAQLAEAERQREWNELRRQLDEEHEAVIKQVTAEWRAKSISLAQRLAKTEAELALPRPEDTEKIKALEGQVRTLTVALQELEKRGKDEPIASYEELNRWAAVPKKEVKPKPVARIKSRTGSSMVLRGSTPDGTLPAPGRQNSQPKDVLTAHKRSSMRTVS